MRHAALEACTHFRIDGQPLYLWDQLSGLYPCGGDDGPSSWVRMHTNFAYHRDGALRLLGLPKGGGVEPADVRQALQRWDALDFEQAAADAGLVVAALRSFDEWDAHPQRQAVALQPLLQWTRLGDAPPRALPALPRQSRPLQGVKVLDLTRILAGPVGTRVLAAHGADVLRVNSPRPPKIGPPRLRFAGADGQRLQRGRGAGLLRRPATGAADADPGPCHGPPDGPGQLREGGSWHVQVSLARTGQWLRGLGRVPDAHAVGPPDFAPYLETTDSGFGRLSALRHAAQLSATPAGWARPSMPPGSHPLAWPAA